MADADDLYQESGCGDSVDDSIIAFSNAVCPLRANQFSHADRIRIRG
jgi:hypothetical protein